MKSEPYEFSIEDLINSEGQMTAWEGVRSYEARNNMRDKMSDGDGVFFYHSNIKSPAIVGTMEVVGKPYPDPTQFDPDSEYFDPKSTTDNPRWYLVDVRFAQKFDHEVTRDMLKETGDFSEMDLFRKSRLSVQPVTRHEWEKIHKLAGNS